MNWPLIVMLFMIGLLILVLIVGIAIGEADAARRRVEEEHYYKEQQRYYQD